METKKYGVKKLWNGRYMVLTDVTEKNGLVFFHRHPDLNYAKKDFALKKAESLQRAFCRHLKEKISFISAGEVLEPCGFEMRE